MRHIPTLRLRASALFLALASSLAHAHIAALEAVLEPGQEVEQPAGTFIGTRGFGEFVLQEDGSLEATVVFVGLTAAPRAAHVHLGLPGTVGAPIVDFSFALAGETRPAGTLVATGQPALTPAQQQSLFAGATYFNIHTPGNPAGEIRGQIQLKRGPCLCTGAESTRTFKRCVKRELRKVRKDERNDASIRALRRQVGVAACGKPTIRRNVVTCCLPITPAQNLVTDPMCATVRVARCQQLGGKTLGGVLPCSPNPCAALAPPPTDGVPPTTWPD